MQMFEWLDHQRELFLLNHTNLGSNRQVAVELQDEHNQFVAQSMVNTWHLSKKLGLFSEVL